MEANLDVFTRSYTEGENTIIEFDMRKRDWQKEAGISHNVYWPEKTYNVDIHEFSKYLNTALGDGTDRFFSLRHRLSNALRTLRQEPVSNIDPFS